MFQHENVYIHKSKVWTHREISSSKNLAGEMMVSKLGFQLLFLFIIIIILKKYLRNITFNVKFLQEKVHGNHFRVSGKSD
jgi:hypothetical protein